MPNKPAYGANVASPRSLNNRFLNTDWASAGTIAAFRTRSLSSEAPINVKDFGAVGDGLTDDTAAIQTAIDAAWAKWVGGSVYFPSGVYVVSALILPGDNWHGYDDLELYGEAARLQFAWPKNEYRRSIEMQHECL